MMEAMLLERRLSTDATIPLTSTCGHEDDGDHHDDADADAFNRCYMRSPRRPVAHKDEDEGRAGSLEQLHNRFADDGALHNSNGNGELTSHNNNNNSSSNPLFATTKDHRPCGNVREMRSQPPPPNSPFLLASTKLVGGGDI